MKKAIRLTENDLVRLVKRVISEQNKLDIVVTQGSRAHGTLKGKTLTIETENGQVQKFEVTTTLPQGEFMFEHGKDGQFYGYDPNKKKGDVGHKVKITILRKLK